MTRGVKLASGHRARNDDQFVRFDSAGGEHLEIEAARHPDLVHLVANFHPVERQAIGLEHRSPDVIGRAAHPVQFGRRPMGDADAPEHEVETGPAAEKSIADVLRQILLKHGRIRLALIERRQVYSRSQWQREIQGVARQSSAIEEWSGQTDWMDLLALALRRQGEDRAAGHLASGCPWSEFDRLDGWRHFRGRQVYLALLEVRAQRLGQVGRVIMRLNL